MKRLFNKSANASSTPSNLEDPDLYQSISTSSRNANRQSYRDDEEQYDSKGRSISNSAQHQQKRGDIISRNQALSSPTSGKLPRSGKAAGPTGAAYPTYGEIQFDSNENRGGGGFVAPSSAEPGEAVYHQKLPAQANLPRSTGEDRHHSRTQSNVSSERGGEQNQAYKSKVDPKLPDPLPNPFGNKDTISTEPKSSLSKTKGAALKRLRSTSNRRDQFTPQEGSYDIEEGDNGRPSRRASLLYGIDSGVHGGFASAALVNASERESREAINDPRRDRDAEIVKPESRYIDRYVDLKTPQSVAIGAGMDKMKKLFGRRNKRDGGVVAEEDDRERESSGDWTRPDVIRPYDSAEAMNRMSGSRDREEMIEQQQQLQLQSEHGQSAKQWLNNKKAAHLHKRTEGAITTQIGLLCIQDEYEWDWSQVEALVHLASHSELASKEAARALRKELKYGEEEPRYRAVRLWAIISLRAGDRFRLQVANKKFIDVLEDLYTDKKTSTKVQGRLLLAWSVLAWEFQSDQDLRPITKMFNKIKPNDMPINGLALDPDNDLFGPFINDMTKSISDDLIKTEEVAPRRYVPQLTETARINDNVTYYDAIRQDEGQPHTQTTTIVQTTTKSRPIASTPGQGTPEEHFTPRQSDEIRRMHQECQVARSNAQLMTEALIEHGLHSDLVIEFAAKTQLSQDYILAQIPWASSRADQSREDCNEGEQQGKSTKEEELLGDLLDTHEKLVAANGMIEEARKREREEQEERDIIERSMREQRIDRSALVQDADTGSLFALQDSNAERNGIVQPGGVGGLIVPSDQARASGSRFPSPLPPVTRRPLPIPGITDSKPNASMPMQKNLSATSQGALPEANGSINTSANGSLMGHSTPNDTLQASKTITSLQRGGPRPMANNSPLPAKLQLTDERYPPSSGGSGGGVAQDEEDSDDSIIKTPLAPSAKALGKRRAVSIYEGSTRSNGNSGSVQELTSQTEAIQLSSDRLQNEEELRARPPPALPPTNPVRQMDNH